MNMIDHKTKTIDNDIVPYCKNRKNRIVYDIVFHIVENIEAGNGTLIYMVGFPLLEFSFLHIQRVL